MCGPHSHPSSDIFSSYRTETQHSGKSSYPFTFCLYKLNFPKFLEKKESFTLCLFVAGLFHLSWYPQGLHVFQDCVRIYILMKAELIEHWVYIHHLLICSPGYMGCFYFLMMASNITQCYYQWICKYFSRPCFWLSGVGTKKRYCWVISFFIQIIAILLSTKTASFYSLTNSGHGFQFLHVLTSIVIFCFYDSGFFMEMRQGDAPFRSC